MSTTKRVMLASRQVRSILVRAIEFEASFALGSGEGEAPSEPISEKRREVKSHHLLLLTFQKCKMNETDIKRDQKT